MKEILLSQCKITLVDDEDYEILKCLKWHAVKTPHTYYAYTNINGTYMIISDN
jgi:hypothetical protein